MCLVQFFPRQQVSEGKTPGDNPTVLHIGGRNETKKHLGFGMKFGHPSLSLLPGPLHAFGWVHVLTYYQIDALANCISIKNHREETEDLVTEQKAIEQAIEQQAIWQQGKCRRLFKTWHGHLSWIFLLKC